MEEVRIVVVPFAAQGHLNQLLHFAINLSSTYHLPVHYASSASYIRQAKSRIQGRDQASLDNIHFHELPLAPFATPLPDPDSHFPGHLLPSFEAAMKLRAPLAALFLSLSVECRRLVVVHDTMMSVVSSDVASLPNAESYRFQCVASQHELHSFCRQPNPNYDLTKLRREVLDVVLDPFEGCITPEVLEFVMHNYRDIAAEAGTLFNTCRPVDGEFLDLLSGVPRYDGKKLFAVGPVNPLAIEKSTTTINVGLLEWLDAQPPASVLYVSFGSTTTMSDEQIEKLATGLERSGHRFIWVLRDADLGDMSVDINGGRQRKLPAGFEERVEGTGVVVRGWAPQLPILAHPSTGGFVSHCGWNSCMESLSMGVPIVAWPVHSDQPRNAVMVTGYLKTGVAVREWDRHKDLVSSEAIEESIKKVMEGDGELRKRARLLGEAIRLSVAEEGGSSRADMDSFVQHITRVV